MRLNACVAALIASLFLFPSCAPVLRSNPTPAPRAEPEPGVKDCVIIGAGFAGVLANMQSPHRCLMIENGAPQGIQQGQSRMLQHWDEVKFIAPTEEPRVWQPSDFKEDTEKTVSVAALEKARQANVKSFAMEVIRGRISDLNVEDETNSVVKMTVTPPGGTPYTVRATYVILATGTGPRPAPLRDTQYTSAEELKWLRENKVHEIPQVLADTELMTEYKAFPEAAKQDRWILSGTNAGSATVAAFLLEHGVPAENITLIGKPDDLEPLRVFGDNPGEGYFGLFQHLREGKLSFLPGSTEKSKKGYDFKKVEKKGDTLVRVSTDAGNTRDAEHFVHAFNMESDLISMFAQELLNKNGKTLQAWPWSKRTGNKCKDKGHEIEVGLLGMRMIRFESNVTGQEKQKGKKEVVTEELLPITLLGAATTTLPRQLWHATHEYRFKKVVDKEVGERRNVYTTAAIPYMAPKIACAAQLLFQEQAQAPAEGGAASPASAAPTRRGRSETLAMKTRHSAKPRSVSSRARCSPSSTGRACMLAAGVAEGERERDMSGEQ